MWTGFVILHLGARAFDRTSAVERASALPATVAAAKHICDRPATLEVLVIGIGPALISPRGFRQRLHEFADRVPAGSAALLSRHR